MDAQKENQVRMRSFQRGLGVVSLALFSWLPGCSGDPPTGFSSGFGGGGNGGGGMAASGAGGSGDGGGGMGGEGGVAGNGGSAGTGGAVPAPQTVIVTVADPGFQRFSASEHLEMGPYWGYYKDAQREYWWTYTNGDVVDCRAEWRPQLTEGWYAVSVRFWSLCDQSTHIPYYVHHKDGVDGPIFVDQFDQSWVQKQVTLGEYFLTSESYVEVRDDTGEPYPTDLAVECLGGSSPLNLNIDTVIFMPVQ